MEGVRRVYLRVEVDYSRDIVNTVTIKQKRITITETIHCVFDMNKAESSCTNTIDIHLQN